MSCLFKYNLCSYWEDQIWTICILYPTIRFTIEWSDAVPYPVSGDNNSTDSHYCCDSWNTGTSIWNVAYLNLIKYDCLYSMCSIFIGMSFQKRVCKLCYIYIWTCVWLIINLYYRNTSGFESWSAERYMYVLRNNNHKWIQDFIKGFCHNIVHEVHKNFRSLPLFD